QIVDLFAVPKLPDIEPHYNIAPTQDVLTIRRPRDADDEAGDVREAIMTRWGLIPIWADDRSIGNKLINARSETVHEKSAFRDAFERRRCLIVADGFLEWKKMQGRKQPFHIQLKDGGPFGFAGLWERWRDEDDEWVISSTILTTRPNDRVEEIHDRMPVIVHSADHELWLEPHARPEDLEGIFEPYPADEMSFTPVNPRINNVAHDDPACLEPVEVQGSLF
ncbi:MAG: SOS response-associated peptidase, partial [Halobacteriales archaeon]|nr:SOS response-associated peptidase [Halobacteriales archaeon]